MPAETSNSSVALSASFDTWQPEYRGSVGTAELAWPQDVACCMSDLASLHKTARSLILSLRDGLEQLERSEKVSYMLA